MADQPHSIPTPELHRSPRVQRDPAQVEEDIARSLVIAQSIADKTVADAKTEARQIVAEAEKRVKPLNGDATQALNVPGGPAGDGAPALSKPGAQADPAPAATPAASAEPQPRDGGRAGTGRPTVSEHGICTDCGHSLTWDAIVGHWWHDDPEAAAMAAFGLDGHLVHWDKLPAHHPNMLAYRPARRSRDHDPVSGRFLPKSGTSAEVAAEHALIDMDAGLYQDDVARRISGALTAVKAIAFNVEANRLEDALAVKAGMLVRLGSDGGGS